MEDFINYLYKCTGCGYEVITHGPREFHRNSAGGMLVFKKGEDVSKIGISGLFVKAYCPCCDATHELVCLEYEQPVDDIYDMFGCGATLRDGYIRHKLVCPTCQGQVFIELEFDEIACPKCHIGKFTRLR